MVHMLSLVNGQIQDCLQLNWLTHLIGDTAWTINAMNLSSGKLLNVLIINRFLGAYNMNIKVFPIKQIIIDLISRG